MKHYLKTIVLVSAILIFLFLNFLLNTTGNATLVLADSPYPVTWFQQFGSSGKDYAYAVTSDSSGNAYVAGYTDSYLPGQVSVGSYDAFLRKYDISGNELWTRQFGTNGEDKAYGLAVDGSSNTYVVGYTWGSLPSQISTGRIDVFVRKYDFSGTELWTRQFGTPGDQSAHGVAVDSSGDIYVVGGTYDNLPGQTSLGDRDAFIRKYNGLGNELWTHQFGSAGNDYAYKVAVDSANNVYISGFTNDILPGKTSSGDWDAFVSKYDSSGIEQWTRQFGTSYDDHGLGIAVDNSGNTYTSGFTNGTFLGQTSSGNSDAFLRAYDGSGTELWTRQFGSNNNDFAYYVALDNASNAYVVGYTDGNFTGETSTGSFDTFIRQYDKFGNALWTHQFGSTSNDYAYGIAVDISGGIIVAGNTEGSLPGQISLGNSDAFAAKFPKSMKNFNIQKMVIDYGRRDDRDSINMNASFKLPDSINFDPAKDSVKFNIDGVNIVISPGSFKGNKNELKYFYDSNRGVDPKIYALLNFKKGEVTLVVNKANVDIINNNDGVTVTFYINSVVGEQTINMFASSLTYPNQR
jgi:hypothetical protein